MTSPDLVSLALGGRMYGGWTNVSIERSIDQMIGTFSLGAAARGDGKDDDFQFKAGEACTISIDGALIMTGWVDQVGPGFDQSSHRIGVSGSDGACDLVDCSAVHKPGSWRNVSIEAIAAELAKPFGITITAKADTGARIKSFALQQGETVQQALERLLRYRGLLAVSTTAGQIEIIAPKTGAPDWTLAGEALLAAEATHDVSERFSDYIVKGQASGDDQAHGKAVAAVKAEANDPAVKRYRPLIIIGEEQSDIASLKTRAAWEATTRAGRSQSARLTMQGWHARDGRLWEPNRIISVSERALFIDGPMLITGVSYQKSEAGTVAILSVSPPEAWTQLAIPPKAEVSRIGKPRHKKAAKA